jgi:hypothetical protein
MTLRLLKHDDDFSCIEVPRNILRFHLDVSFILNCANLNKSQKLANCESYNHTVYLFIHLCLKIQFKTVVTQNKIEN